MKYFVVKPAKPEVIDEITSTHENANSVWVDGKRYLRYSKETVLFIEEDKAQEYAHSLLNEAIEHAESKVAKLKDKKAKLTKKVK